MLARRLPTILPVMTRQEALEVTRLHSVAGLLSGGGLVEARPFRAPHHSISPAGLLGGGSGFLRPGEASLANNGVLFLDEVTEFRRDAIEGLRQPLEDGRVVVARAVGAVEFPARFSLVAASNPCPCGFEGDPRRAAGASRTGSSSTGSAFRVRCWTASTSSCRFLVSPGPSFWDPSRANPRPPSASAWRRLG